MEDEWKSHPAFVWKRQISTLLQGVLLAIALFGVAKLSYSATRYG
jgi:hypothetical protein